jgi:Zn-dependent protease
MSVYDWGRGGPGGSARRRGSVRPSPLFLTVLLVTALGGVLAWLKTAPGSRVGDFGVFLLVLAGWIVSVCFHEFAHAIVAYRAGDRSVESAGYLTLNPFKYTHPALSIIFPLVALVSGGFALPGGAVYLHPHLFRTKAQRSLAAAVGPLVNVVLAFALLALAESELPATEHARFWCAVAFLAQLQLIAAVLNLLPIPGLDGWAIIEPYLSPETQRGAEKVKPWGMLIVIVLLLSSTAIRNRFFDLVDAIYRAMGGNDLYPSVGYELFKFWQKTPL